jgi:hypothetical protein
LNEESDLNIVKKIARYFAAKNFCQTAIAEKADLSFLIKEKLTPAVRTGIILIVFSYIIGLPAVIALGAFAVWWKEPLIGIIGIPLIYGISTVIFIIGIRMAGKKYVKGFARWLTRIILEKILGEEAQTFSARCSEDGPGNK